LDRVAEEAFDFFFDLDDSLGDILLPDALHLVGE
jgi:hypothetical protein